LNSFPEGVTMFIALAQGFCCGRAGGMSQPGRL
jgi:hypothetical protein